MGLKHGGCCAGCCGFLPALLFVAGVMTLLWAATHLEITVQGLPGGLTAPR